MALLGDLLVLGSWLNNVTVEFFISTTLLSIAFSPIGLFLWYRNILNFDHFHQNIYTFGLCWSMLHTLRITLFFMLISYTYNTMGYFRKNIGFEDMEFPGVREVKIWGIWYSFSPPGKRSWTARVEHRADKILKHAQVV